MGGGGESAIVRKRNDALRHKVFKVQSAQTRVDVRGGQSGWFSRYTGRKDGGLVKEVPKPSGAADGTSIEFWDYAPSAEYFDELFRVSKNQIIWGGNYFSLPPTRCFLIWRKLSISESFSMAMAEYAWTSFNGNAKVYEKAPQGNLSEPRFHPTQKPVDLYRWTLGLYAKKGMCLLDTHGGSMGSAIAAYEMGCDMDICEVNDFYFAKGKERVLKAMEQQFFDF